MASEGAPSHRSGSDTGKGKAPITELSPPPTTNFSFFNEDLFVEHFEKVLDPTTGDSRAVCNYCGRDYKFDAGEGYGNFTNHLKKYHSDEIGNYQSQQGSTGSDPSIFRFSPRRARREMAKLVCVMSLPFNFADSNQFEITMKCYNPAAKRISRSALIREIKNLVKETKLVLMNDFANLSNNVSICSDVWSDKWKQFHFIEITCHWVDDKWILQKRVIAYRIFGVDEPTATYIPRKIHKILQKYGLAAKVFSISFDYDTANKYSLESLTEICRSSIGANFFYVRCMSNLLNACVRDGLNKLNDEIDPIRDAVSYLFNYTSLTKKWARFCKQNGLTPKYFWVDVPERWNSTHKLLNDTYQYRDVLCRFLAEQQCDIVLSTNQWDACYNLCQLLTVFKDVIKELSDIYYPTSPLVVDNCVKIALIFNSLIGCDGLGECIAEMMVKWLKHFHEIPIMFLVAKLLDPRVRIDGLEELLGIYYDALFPIKDDKTPIPSVIVANAKACLYDIFNEYRIKYSDSLGLNTFSHDDPSVPLTVRLQNFYDERFGKRPKSYGGSNPYKELETYLTSRFEFMETESFDILKWWSRWNMNFPIVSLIAKDMLAVPASIASVAQAFGEEGYILDERQSRLRPENLENQKLLGDWTKAEDRLQEIDTDEGDMSDTIDTDSDNDSYNDMWSL